MRDQKGITLTAVAIYIIIFIAIVGLLMSLSSYISTNMQDVNIQVMSAEDFNKFNTEFVGDIKQSTEATIDNSSDNIQILLSNGTNYNYISEEKAIYKNHVKLANNIAIFSAERDIINNKKVIKITIGTGKSAEDINFGKKINYVLNYWD